MKTLHTGSASLDLNGFIRDVEAALRINVTERYSDNIPGGRYYVCAVPGIRLIVCEDLDAAAPNMLAPDRFMIFVDFEFDIAPEIEAAVEAKILGVAEESLGRLGYKFILRNYE